MHVPSSASSVDHVDARIRPVGSRLAHSLQALLEAIPGAPHKPTPLSRRLGMNRVTTSRVLNAITQADACEVLQRLPGPESLRALTEGAARLSVEERLIEQAADAIRRFEELIREEFGTRGALNAAISPAHPETDLRFAQSSRYQAFKGMREVLGVSAETWLTCMLFAPDASSPDMLSISSIQGALGMRRLRPDVEVYFTSGRPRRPVEDPAALRAEPVDLSDLYTNQPAALETHVAGGQLVHRLAHYELGRRALVDMLIVSHEDRAARRYATAERPLGGAIVVPDVPVKTLLFDVLLHAGAFAGATPELFVYRCSPLGAANPCDASRDVDRVPTPERIESPTDAATRFDVQEIPHYAAMIERVARLASLEPQALRVFRFKILYPLYGFQYVMAFPAPQRPSSSCDAPSYSRPSPRA